MNHADTGFIVSLYLAESTSGTARGEAALMSQPMALVPLSRLEIRNAFNRAVNRGRISLTQRDAYWEKIEEGSAAVFSSRRRFQRRNFMPKRAS